MISWLIESINAQNQKLEKGLAQILGDFIPPKLARFWTNLQLHNSEVLTQLLVDKLLIQLKLCAFHTKIVIRRNEKYYIKCRVQSKI